MCRGRCRSTLPDAFQSRTLPQNFFPGGGTGQKFCGKLAPVVARGAVLARKPQVILIDSGQGAQAALDAWKRWPWLPAVEHGNLFLVPATVLGRADNS